MKLFTKLLCVAGLALSMGAAQAGTVLNNWRFNPAGTGYGSATKINEYLDVNGNAFIDLTLTGGSTFSFVEHAVFNIAQHDSSGALFAFAYPGKTITATFEAAGAGTFSGGFAFTSGTIRMYVNSTAPGTTDYGSALGIYGADLGNIIAEFAVLPGGGGLVDASGIPTTNGQITVFAKADIGKLDPGFFFRNGGADLALEDILSFAFTNANTVGEPEQLLVDEVACQYAGFTGDGCNANPYANAPGDYFFVSNNGQFKLANVPEPGSLALFGIALLGAGVVSRKRAANKA
jgi:hypothetical protein